MSNEISNDNYDYVKLATEAKQIHQEIKSLGGKEKISPNKYARLQEINQIVYDKMKKYITKFLNDNYPTYCRSEAYEDMQQVCYMEVLERFPEYDGRIQLTTYFQRWMRGACNTYIGATNNKSRYYNEKSIVIGRAISELMKEGLDKSDITDAEIQAKINDPKLSKDTIAKVRKMDDYQVEEFNAEVMDQNKLSKSPEDAFLEKERNEKLAQILIPLLPYERIAYCLKNSIYTDETGYFVKRGLTHRLIGMSPKFLEALRKAGKGKMIIQQDEKEIKIPKDDKASSFSITEYVPAEKVANIISRAKKKIVANPEVMASMESTRKSYAASVNAVDMATVKADIEILALNDQKSKDK